ncbi:MAG TPA: histidine kinase dimerization/phospho-acceptor domain-containing protein [Gammaproteobacteria bacterium]|nr:histidine kinase dimerization/phospho-acceptor domain-containing protein [Gammaproteobacteria bacterium]
MQALKRIKALFASVLKDNEEKDMLQSILTLMPGHVYWMNDQGFYLGSNHNQAKSAGPLSTKDINGKKNADLPWNVYSPLLPEALDDTNQAVIKTGKSIILEEPAVLQEGTELMFLSHKTPLYNKKGSIIGMVGISRNITDRKKAEKELALEKVKAEVANQSKIAFLNNMRHDIRTALAGIVGATDLLKNETDNAKIDKYTQGLNNVALELLQFLNAILESVRMASGDMPLYTQKFSLTETLENVVSLHQPLALQKKLDLRLNIDKSIPKHVIGDSFRIYRIVLELLANALKFTTRGEVNVIATLVKKLRKTL